MSAYMSRGAGVLVKLRVEHRVSLAELALVLFTTDIDSGDESLSVSDIRKAITTRLAEVGTEAVTDATDSIGEASEHGEEDDAADRLAWARRAVARAYRRDFARFPSELATFEAATELGAGGGR